MSNDTPTSDNNGTEETNIPRDMNEPCHISIVNFEGIYRSRPSLVGKIVSEIYHTKTWLDFFENCVRIKENLNSLNSFNDVEIQVNSENKDNNYNVTFVLQEKGRLGASITTAFERDNGHLNIQLSSPNITGNFDSLKLNLKLNKQLNSGDIRYTAPLVPWRRLWAPIYSGIYSEYPWDRQLSGFDLMEWSVINQLDFRSLTQLKHTINLDNIRRQITSTDPQRTPIAIKEQCGHSVKSTIRHTMEWDNRIGGNYPYEGIMARLSNEITTNLVNGGAKFSRHELNLQVNQLLLPKYDLLCQLNIMAGTLYKPLKYNICDKFFVGGPLTLRGFKPQGLGSNVDGHPLGDLSYLTAGLHIYPRMPYTTPLSSINQYIRPHIFVNTGTIGDINVIPRIHNREEAKRELNRFTNSLRYSFGIGLVIYVTRLRIEVNYSVPLVSKECDMTARGFQWGFGINYT